MNTDNYIPVLMWEQKKIIKAVTSINIEIPITLYSKDGYPENKKQLQPAEHLSTEELEELQSRAQSVVTVRISKEISRLVNKSVYAKIYTYIDSILTHSTLYIALQDGAPVLIIKVPIKHYLPEAEVVFKIYIDNFFEKEPTITEEILYNKKIMEDICKIEYGKYKKKFLEEYSEYMKSNEKLYNIKSYE